MRCVTAGSIASLRERTRLNGQVETGCLPVLAGFCLCYNGGSGKP